jgi:hypothetical protein
MTKAQGDPPPEHDALRSLLVQQAEQIAALRRDLDRLAQETVDAFTVVHDRLDEAPATSGELPAPNPAKRWCWRDLDDTGSEQMMEQLTDWVDWLRSRYPLARRVPPCWAEHPETIEELTAVWLAWQHAYAEPDAPLTAAADWHERWLPGFLYRLQHGPFALDCGDVHQPRTPSSYGGQAR